MHRTVLFAMGVTVATACAARAQEPPLPPPTPPVQASAPPVAAPLPAQDPPPASQTPPPAQAPAAPPPAGQAAPPAQPPAQPPAVPSPAEPAPPSAPPPPLSAGEMRARKDAIFLMEGLLANAVKLAAQYTASEIQRVEPGLVMFSAAPVKAHGTYLEDYGVFFEVEIPSVIPSVASLVERIGRTRVNSSPAQPTALTGGSTEALMNPDAHYVESVKTQLVNAMIRQSNQLELRPGEWLTVAARDGSESPGQLSEPSTMILRIRGTDLADFFAGRITIEEARRRVQVRGF